MNVFNGNMFSTRIFSQRCVLHYFLTLTLNSMPLAFNSVAWKLSLFTDNLFSELSGSSPLRFHFYLSKAIVWQPKSRTFYLYIASERLYYITILINCIKLADEFMWRYFCRYTILWEREKARNKKRKRIGFRNTGRKRNAFRITGRIPQAGCFFAHLSCVKTEHLPPGWYNLHHFCCPLHKVSRVEEIIRTAEGVILYGGGESQEPLCVDDEIHISLQNGLEADERTQDDQTQLR